MKNNRCFAFALCILFVACIVSACAPTPGALSLVGSWESACNHPQNEKSILTFSEDGTMLIETFKYGNKLYEIPGTFALESEAEITFRIEDALFGAQNGSWLYLIKGERLYFSHDGTPIDTDALEKTEQYYVRRQSETETGASQAA